MSNNVALILRERELDLAFVAGDPLSAHLDRVAEPIAAARAAPNERRSRRVQLEELTRQAARGEEAFEHLAEACEETGTDDAGDLAVERVVPAVLAQAVLEQPREADLVGGVLHLRR